MHEPARDFAERHLQTFEQIHGRRWPIDSSNPEAQRHSWLSLHFWRPYSCLGVLLFVLILFVNLRRQQDWETVYLPAATRLAEGRDIYQEGFVYPPINAWLFLPFADLPRSPGLLLWSVINIAALGALILGAWKLSGGERLEGTPTANWREHLIFWLGLGCGISACLDVITNQQTDLIIAALVVLGCLALSRQRDWSAALWFGVAAGIKCTPLLWAGYLAWRKRWTASLAVVGIAVLINLIPDLTHPPASSTPRSIDWARRFLMPMAEREHELGTWACGVGGNQSVAGLWQRCLTYDAVWDGEGLDITPRSDQVAPDTLKAVSFGTMSLLVAAGLACSWRGRRNPVELAGSSGKESLAVECGMVLILMVLLSPHSSLPHFCTLLLPGFCVARAALAGPNRALLALLFAVALMMLLASKDIVGQELYAWGKWYGVRAWCALLLYAVSCRILLTSQPDAAAATDDGHSEERIRLRQAA